MAESKVGRKGASGAEEREVKTAPELTDAQIDQDIEMVVPDVSIDEPAMPQEDSGPTEKTPRPAVLAPEPASKPPVAKRLASWIGSHKKVSIPLGVLLLLGLLAAIPATRYALAGTVLKQQFAVMVVDAETKQPVTSATVRIDGVEVTTDNKGRATAKVAVGSAKIEVSKKYFKSAEQTVTVPIFKQKDVPELRLQATGRQIAVKVTNKIDKKPLANVTITAAGADAKTDSDGTATLVMPAGEENVEATLKAQGFNDGIATIQVMKGESENNFTLTPSGRIYFLSNQNGKLDVVKTNLDGTDRQVVLAGTGREDRNSSYLLTTRDGRYVSLIARRDSDKAKVYVIDTQGDKLTTVDEGDAGFSFYGWSNHHLVYRVTRDNIQWGEARKIALKTFNAETKKLTTIDESEPGESYGGVFVSDGEIMFAESMGTDAAKKNTLVLVGVDGEGRRNLKEYPTVENGRYSTFQVVPNYVSALILSGVEGSYHVDEFKNGQLKATSMSADDFWDSEASPRYLSPSGQKSLWTEVRDGKSVVFIGDKNAANGKEIARLEHVQVYGWSGNDYVILSKEGRQLLIGPADSIADEAALVKVSDYTHSTGYDHY